MRRHTDSVTGASASAAIMVTVTANPLWTDTGISLTPSDSITIYGAAGTWAWSDWPIPPTGPDGDANPSYAWEFWMTGGRQGQLIGFVGPATPDLNEFPRVIAQDDFRLFAIGTATIALTGLEGVLWLGMNDAYNGGDNAGHSNYVDDNTGSVTVWVGGGTIQPPDNNGTVPEPSTLAMFLGLGGMGLIAAWRRRKRAA